MMLLYYNLAFKSFLVLAPQCTFTHTTPQKKTLWCFAKKNGCVGLICTLTTIKTKQP